MCVTSSQLFKGALIMLRDKLAMAAMQGLISSRSVGQFDNEWVASEAYKIAQAMLDEREQWEFDGDPETPTGYIVSDTPIRRVAVPHGVNVVVEPGTENPYPWKAPKSRTSAYTPAGENTRRALTEELERMFGRNIYCNGFSIDGLISVLEAGDTIGLTEELTPAGHTTKAVLKDAIKRFHGHDNVSVTDPLEELIDRLETGLPF